MPSKGNLRMSSPFTLPVRNSAGRSEHNIFVALPVPRESGTGPAGLLLALPSSESGRFLDAVDICSEACPGLPVTGSASAAEEDPLLRDKVPS